MTLMPFPAGHPLYGKPGTPGVSPLGVPQQNRWISTSASTHWMSASVTNIRSSDLPVWAQPDSAQPDTLGWRAWKWSEATQCLCSPHQDTLWSAAELHARIWSDEEAVRGCAGIHARLLPQKKWQLIGWPDGDASQDLDGNPFLVTGIVERFGRFVLGTTGWRAEKVVIKELLAPSTEIGLLLEQKYPDVIIHYPDQYEGDRPCTSVKSSASANVNQSMTFQGWRQQLQNQHIQSLPNQKLPPVLSQTLSTRPSFLSSPPSQAANPPTQNPRQGPNISLTMSKYESPPESLFERMLEPRCLGLWCTIVSAAITCSIFYMLLR